MLDLLHNKKVVETWGQRSSLIWKMRNDHPHFKRTFHKAHIMTDKGGKDELSVSSHDEHAAIPWLGTMHVSIISDLHDHGADSALNRPYFSIANPILYMLSISIQTQGT